MKSSPLERRFDLYWKAVDGPALVPEHRFHPVRRWRFDRAHLASKVAIEIEGGVWNGGRHVRGAGFTGDCEKTNEAAIDGWIVLRLTREHITLPYLERLAKFVGIRAELRAAFNDALARE